MDSLRNRKGTQCNISRRVSSSITASTETKRKSHCSESSNITSRRGAARSRGGANLGSVKLKEFVPNGQQLPQKLEWQQQLQEQKYGDGKIHKLLDWLEEWDGQPWYVNLKAVESKVVVQLQHAADSTMLEPPTAADTADVAANWLCFEVGEQKLLQLSREYTAFISQDAEQRWLLQLASMQSIDSNSKTKHFTKKKQQPQGCERENWGDLQGKSTHHDTLSALTILSQQQPLCSLSWLHRLLFLAAGVSRKSTATSTAAASTGGSAPNNIGACHRSGALAARDSLFQLFQGSSFLPNFRKLQGPQQQPEWVKSCCIEFYHGRVERLQEQQQPQQQKQQWQNLPNCLQQLAVLWRFEIELKNIFTRFVQLLRVQIEHEPLLHFSRHSLRMGWQLLLRKKEQEQQLLLLVVNSLAHKVNKMASEAGFLLSKLLLRHPPMRQVVIQYVASFLASSVSAALKHTLHAAAATWQQLLVLLQQPPRYKQRHRRRAYYDRSQQQRQRQSFTSSTQTDARAGDEDIKQDTQGGISTTNSNNNNTKRVLSLRRLLGRLATVRHQLPASEYKLMRQQMMELLLPPSLHDFWHAVYRGILFLSELRFRSGEDSATAAEVLRIDLHLFTRLHRFPVHLAQTLKNCSSQLPTCDSSNCSSSNCSSSNSGNTCAPLDVAATTALAEDIAADGSTDERASAAAKNSFDECCEANESKSRLSVQSNFGMEKRLRSPRKSLKRRTKDHVTAIAAIAIANLLPLYSLPSFSRLVRALLVGIHRLFPYLPDDVASATASVSLQQQQQQQRQQQENGKSSERDLLLETLYTLSHSLPAPASRIVVLRLLHRILCGNSNAAPYRLFRTVYEQLKDPEMLESSNRTVFFSLIAELMLPQRSRTSCNSSISDSAAANKPHMDTERIVEVRESQNDKVFLLADEGETQGCNQPLSCAASLAASCCAAICKRLLQLSLIQQQQPGAAAAASRLCSLLLSQQRSRSAGSKEVNRLLLLLLQQSERQLLRQRETEQCAAEQITSQSDEEEFFRDIHSDDGNESHESKIPAAAELRNKQYEKNRKSGVMQLCRREHGIAVTGDGELLKNTEEDDSLRADPEKEASSEKNKQKLEEIRHCAYDPLKRDPHYSGAAASKLWELAAASAFYHPAVSSVTKSILTVSCTSSKAGKQNEQQSPQQQKQPQQSTGANACSRTIQEDGDGSLLVEDSESEDFLALCNSFTHFRVLDLLAYKPTAAGREVKHQSVGAVRGHKKKPTTSAAPLDSWRYWAARRQQNGAARIFPEEAFMAAYFEDPHVINQERLQQIRKRGLVEDRSPDEERGSLDDDFASVQGSETERELLSDEEVDVFLKKQHAELFGNVLQDDDEDVESDLYNFAEDGHTQSEKFDREAGDEVCGEPDSKHVVEDDKGYCEEHDSGELSVEEGENARGYDRRSLRNVTQNYRGKKRKVYSDKLIECDSPKSKRERQLNRLRQHVKKSCMQGRGDAFVCAEGIEDLLSG